jgi:hypothetical protein
LEEPLSKELEKEPDLVRRLNVLYWVYISCSTFINLLSVFELQTRVIQLYTRNYAISIDLVIAGSGASQGFKLRPIVLFDITRKGDFSCEHYQHKGDETISSRVHRLGAWGFGEKWRSCKCLLLNGFGAHFIFGTKSTR